MGTLDWPDQKETIFKIIGMISFKRGSLKVKIRSDQCSKQQGQGCNLSAYFLDLNNVGNKHQKRQVSSS